MTPGHETRNEAFFLHYGYVPETDKGDGSESEDEDLESDEVDLPRPKRKRTNKGKKSTAQQSHSKKVPYFQLVNTFFKHKKKDPLWGDALGKGAWVE